MISEKLYEEKYSIYKKNISFINIIKIQLERVSIFYKFVFWFIAIAMAFVASIIIFSEDDIFLNSAGILVIILAIPALKLFNDESKKQLNKYYGMEESSNFNFYYHPIIKIFFTKEEKPKKEELINQIIDFNDLNIEVQNSGFLNSPFIVIIISFVSAIVVNLLTGIGKLSLDKTQLVILIILVVFILLLIYMFQDSFNTNKRLSFKKFLYRYKYQK